MNFILGKKVKMTQVFTENGRAIPVTVVEAGPCLVVQKRTAEHDGYVAVQVGWGEDKRLSRPQRGHLRNLPPLRFLKEFRVKREGAVDLDSLQRGDEIRVSTFSVGERVDVVGISKGKGFQGVVKRHGFAGGPASHGHKDQLRMPGSIGATDPARVFKGTRMAGRMGGEQVTVKNLEIVKIDEENNLLYLRGAVPGPRGSLVKIVGQGELKIVKPSEQKTEDKEQKVEDNVSTEQSSAEDTKADQQSENQEQKQAVEGSKEEQSAEEPKTEGDTKEETNKQASTEQGEDKKE